MIDDITGKTVNVSTTTFTNVAQLGSIHVIKKSDTTPEKVIQGVEFKLTLLDSGKATTTTYTKTTDKNGELTFDNLLPGTYRLTETKTVKGYQLMQNPMEITIPVKMTETEATAAKADMTKARKDGKGNVYFFDVECVVKDTVTYDVPHTGGTGIWYIQFAAGLAGIAFVLLMFRKRKRITE